MTSFARAIAVSTIISATCAARADDRIYASDFASGKPDPHWSAQDLTKAPVGNRTFLGEFGEQEVTLALEKLPPHAFVRVNFDLLILTSWDGSGRESPPKNLVGPDFWRLAIDDGRTLTWHTFSNIPKVDGFADECKWQTYPSPVPGDRCESQHGAAEAQTLGYTFGRQLKMPMDATYRITMTFPHRADAVRFTFAAGGLQGVVFGKNDESWGLDRVVVETLDRAPAQAPEDAAAAEKLLSSIAEDDALAGNEWFLRLITGGRATRDVLQRARRDGGYEENRMRETLARLGDPDAAVREKAAAELTKLGALAEPMLWDATRSDSPEASAAAWRILQAIAVGNRMKDIPTRRAWIASRALHVMGSE